MTLKPIYQIVVSGHLVQYTFSDTINTSSEVYTPQLFELKNVLSVSVEEDINSLTDNAVIEIPVSYFKVTTNGLVYNTGDKNYRVSNNGNSTISIRLGYADREFTGLLGNYNAIEVFKGYIKDYVFDTDRIRIVCENSMFLLKKGNTVKRSYPSPLQAGIIDALKPSLYVGQEFKLHHLLYNLFNYTTVLPTITNIYSYPDFALGKLRINDRLQLAEVLKFLKDKYGIYVYFRLSGYSVDKGIYYRNEHLHIGYKYWNNSEYTDITTMIATTNVSKEQFSNWNNIHKFSYTYSQDNNRIIESNLDWVDTDKEDLVITIRSVQDKTSELITYIYPENKQQYDNLYVKMKTPDNKLTDNAHRLAVREDLADKGIQDYVIFSENNSNTIDINIPGLDLETMKARALKKYNEYQDTGYQGSFTTFGEPFVSKGDIVQLSLKMSSPLLNSDEEVYMYYVDKVIRTYNTSYGYRQEIFIGNRYYK